MRPAKIQISLRIRAVWSESSPGAFLNAKDQRCKVASCEQQRLWSDCAGTQAHKSLRWAHMSEGTFSHVVVHFGFCFYLMRWVINTVTEKFKTTENYLQLKCEIEERHFFICKQWKLRIRCAFISPGQDLRCLNGAMCLKMLGELSVLRHLLWVYTLHWNLSVRIRRINTAIWFSYLRLLIHVE